MAIVTIRGSVGEKGTNTPEDVQRIADALSKLGYIGSVRCSEKRTVSSGGKTLRRECPSDVVRAIKTFQSSAFAGAPSGTIYTTGSSIGMLNQLLHPLELTTLACDRWGGDGQKIVNGGFVIKYKGIGKKTYVVKKATGKDALTVSLVVGGRFRIDITGQNPARSGGVIDKKHLPALLSAVESARTVSRTVPCSIIVERGDKLISRSKETKPLPIPVPPHNGQLLPLDQKNNGPKLTYQGRPYPKEGEKKEFWGRTIVKIDGSNKLYFMYLDGFEGNPGYRGFDCTTYAGTTLGVPWNDMGGNGESLRVSLGLSASVFTKAPKEADEKDPKAKAAKSPAASTAKAPAAKAKGETVTLSNASTDDVKEFFKTKRTGVFLMYKSSHVMLVYNSEVHEFTKSKDGSVNGYRCTPVQKRLDELANTKPASKLTVCLAKKTWGAAEKKLSAKADAIAIAQARASQAKAVTAAVVASAAANRSFFRR